VILAEVSGNSNAGDALATGGRVVAARQTVTHTVTHPSRIILRIIPRQVTFRSSATVGRTLSAVEVDRCT